MNPVAISSFSILKRESFDILHVDLCGWYPGTDLRYIGVLVSYLNTMIALKKFGKSHDFLGLEAHRSDTQLLLCQKKYSSNMLLKTGMDDANCNPTLMTVGT